MNKKEVLIITGPTGVGKTDFVDRVSSSIPSEIVNLDVGQFYKPFAIGTAKPDFSAQNVPHHLFDIIDKPMSYTVHQYRADIINKVEEIWGRGKLPILVGGSGFYLLSLFFPPISLGAEPVESDEEASWQRLHELDPKRAEEIGKNDPYRIQRALEIAATGAKPSELKPEFKPFCPASIIVLTRPRDELYDRINSRTEQMIQEGWVNEVEVASAEWKEFLAKKKLIGYDDIVDYLSGKINLERLKDLIRKKTRNYAKRQMTFFRMLERKIKGQKDPKFKIDFNWLDLTLNDLGLYIKQLQERY